MGLSTATVERIREYARRYPTAQSAILPALWAVQHEIGYVTDEGMQVVAQELRLPPSLVEATSTFYSMYLTRPEGRHDVVMCVNVACALRGADELFAYSEQRLGIRDRQTTPDGAITLRSTIECLGGCGGAPMFQVDHRFEENLTPERVNAIFDRLRTEPAPAYTPRPSPPAKAGEGGSTATSPPPAAEATAPAPPEVGEGKRRKSKKAES